MRACTKIICFRGCDGGTAGVCKTSTLETAVVRIHPGAPRPYSKTEYNTSLRNWSSRFES